MGFCAAETVHKFAFPFVWEGIFDFCSLRNLSSEFPSKRKQFVLDFCLFLPSILHIFLQHI